MDAEEGDEGGMKRRKGDVLIRRPAGLFIHPLQSLRMRMDSRSSSESTREGLSRLDKPSE